MNQDYQNYFYAGLKNFEKEQYQEAIENFTKAIKLKPDYAEAYNKREVAKDKLRELEEVIKNYTEAIKLNPKDASAYNHRGVAKYKLRDFQEAIKDFDEAIKLKPKSDNVYYNRGNSKANLEMYEEAIEDYNQAIKLNPKDADAYSNRGVSISRLGKFKEAIKDFDEAIKLNPNYALAYYNRGSDKTRLGEYKKAIEDFREAIKLNPNDAESYNNQGTAKNNLGRSEEAIEDHTEAIRLKPDYVDAYYNRGNAKYKLERFKGAIEDYNQTIKLKSDYAKAYNNRGITYRKLGKETDAIKDFQKANELDPTSIIKDTKEATEKIEKEVKEASKATKKIEKEVKETKKTQQKVENFQEVLGELKNEYEQPKMWWLVISIGVSIGVFIVFSLILFFSIFKIIICDVPLKEWNYQFPFFIVFVLGVFGLLFTPVIHNKVKRVNYSAVVNWLRTAVLFVIGFIIIYSLILLFSIFEITTYEDPLKVNYLVYPLIVFLSSITFFVFSQYAKAKNLYIEANNRVAMAKLFEKIKQDSQKPDNKINYETFIPKISEALIYSTRKSKTSDKFLDSLPSLEVLQAILNKLKDKA